MNAIASIITTVFWMIYLMVYMKVQAQWTTLKARIQESGISKLTRQTHHNYKGLNMVPI